MKRCMVFIILILSGCVIQDDVPQINITLIDHPQELIVTDTHEFTISLTNEGEHPLSMSRWRAIYLHY